MENASKALIIAGAILISIILISIGIMVIQSGQQLVSEAEQSMDEQTLLAYNTKYTNYIGRQRGSTIRTLVQQVQSNNASNPDLLISVIYGGTTYTNQDVTNVISLINSSSTYEVSVAYSPAGRVNQVTITAPTTT